jgi:glycosyltransferase XagB
LDIAGIPSARHGATPLQKWAFAVVVIAVIAVDILTGATSDVVALTLSPIFLSVVFLWLAATAEPPLSPPVLTAIHDLPSYTVLVPLYREAEVAGQLIGALAALDYPKHLLEAFLLLEADDHMTISAIRSQSLPDWIHIVIVPPGQPRTKPRALNHGLDLARGDIVTVYDAEDIPDPDQLRKAAAIFAHSSPDVICLQARLAIDNAPDSWFALMMSIEYSSLFEVIKPGFVALNLPLPLGGTSNHFRTRLLRNLGGWDSWNVTEDADLGLRIARAGLRVGDLPSLTLEEAPVSFSAWLAQRRRWMKGWVQTAIAHASPNACKSIGQTTYRAWLAGMVEVAGVVLSALLYPFFLVHLAVRFHSGSLFEAGSWTQLTINSLALVLGFFGIVALCLPAIIGLKRRRQWMLTPWLITLPIYLLVVSLAAWMALWDLARRPFHWDKTMHGIGRRRPDLFKNRR